MSLVDWLFVTAAVSRVSLVWGVLLIAAGLTALAVLGRDQLVWLVQPILVWLGMSSPRESSAVDLEPSGEIPLFMQEAMGRYRGGHRRRGRGLRAHLRRMSSACRAASRGRVRRGVGLRSRSTVCPPRPPYPTADEDAPTVTIPAITDTSRDGDRRA